MTPEERAATVVEAWSVTVPPPTRARLGDLVAAAIREAVAAERERCARLVESFDATVDGEPVTPGLGHWREHAGDDFYVPDAEAIAAHIRREGGAF